MSVVTEGSELTLRGFHDETSGRTIIVGPIVGHGGNAAICTGRLKERRNDEPEILALKVFRYLTTPQHSKLLRREVAFSSSLRHPHILPFVGTCYVNFSTILVSHFMKNGNLCDYLKSNPQADKDLLVLQVSRALSYLHNDAKIIHGDLKCENVLVSDYGDAVLTDFGLSTTVDKAEGESTTMTAIRDMNTIQFCAPEIFLADDSSATRVRSKTCESDIYAFGMLLLQAYTGKLPRATFSQQAIILQMVQGVIPSQPDPLTMDNFLWSLCTTCWKVVPSTRPTIQSVVNFLELHLAVNTSTITPPVLSEPQDNLFTTTKNLHILLNNEARNLVMRVQIHLLSSPVGVLDDHDTRILRKLLSTESGVRALKDAPDAEKIIMAAIAAYALDSAVQDAADTIADAAIAILVLDAAGKNDDVYYSTAQLRPVIARARQRDSELSNRLERLFAPAQTQRPRKHPDEVNCVVYMPDGDRIVSGCDDGAVRMWDVKTGQVVGAPMIGHTGWVYCVAVLADGTQIASGSKDATIRIWSAATGAVVAVLEGHDYGVRSVAFSPDGKRVVSSSEDDTIRVWDVASGKTVVGPIKGRSVFVSSVAYSADGLRLASGADGTVRVWDAETGQELWQAEMGFIVYSVAYSRNGTRIVAGCSDWSVRVLDAETGEIVLGPLIGHTDDVSSVAFSSDGTKIASGSDDHTARIWDAETGAELDVLRGHMGFVWSVAFSPEGKHVASASKDKTVRIWDATGEWKRW